MQTPLLQVQKLVKRYQRGWPRTETTFELQADFEVDAPTVIGVLGQDIHRVRYGERDRLALHYHQSYQLRRFRRTRPRFMLEAARTSQAAVHLFDEPQFNTQDGYIGFMLEFFRRLRASGKVVFLCLHPNEPVHLEILEAACERFIFVDKDDARISRLREAASWRELVAWPAAASYLGALLNR